MAKSVQAQGLSKQLVEKARREGRFVDGRVYATKNEANLAKQGGGAKQKKKAGGAKAQSGLGANREIHVVERTMNVPIATGVGNITYSLNGGEVEDWLKEFEARHYKVTGVEFEMNSPLLDNNSKGRIAVAFATAISAGDKTPAEIGRLNGAAVLQTIEFVDRIVKAKMPRAIEANKYDESDNCLTPADQIGIIIFGSEIVAAAEDEGKTIAVKARFTLTVDKVKASGSGVTSI